MGSDSDCLHILALIILFDLSDLPLALKYSSCVVASFVCKQSLSQQLSLIRSPGEFILTRLQILKDNVWYIQPSSFYVNNK